MIKLIASDIDGTLIKESTPDLYPEFVQTAKKLIRQGIHICAASGRQYDSIRNVFRELLEEDIIFIAENGALIRYKDENISVTPMDRKAVEELIKQLRTYHKVSDIVVSTPKGSLLESDNKEFIDMITYGYRNKFTLVEDVLAEDAEIIKVALYQKESVRALGEEVLIPEWKDRLKVCMAGEEWVDFMDLSVDKGHALRFIQEYFKVSKEETMAFGDNNNDIGMLEAAGISYAVATARDEVKAVADKICPSYLDKGVNQILSELVI